MNALPPTGEELRQRLAQIELENAALREQLAARAHEPAPPRLDQSLEQQVDDRTAELRAVVMELEAEMQERRRVEAQLQRSRTMTEAFLDHAPGLLALQDSAGRYLFGNLAFARLAGLTHTGALEGKTDAELFQTAWAARLQIVRANILASGEVFVHEYVLPTEHGARALLVHNFPIRNGGTITHIGFVATDITAIVRAEQAVRASEARLRTLVRHISGAAVLLFDHDLRYLVADGQGLGPLGLSRELMEGNTLAEVVPPAVAVQLEPLYRATLAGSPPPEHDFPAMDRIFRMLFAPVRDEHGHVASGMLLAIDITEMRHDEVERLALQQRLQEAQRLESIGTLAGGLAHDFNNLLQSILGHAELLRIDLPEARVAPSLRAIINGAAQAAELTAQLLAYAGKSNLLLQPVMINELVREVAGFARTTLHQQAQVQLQLADALPLVEADTVQLRQMVLNLLLNASEALGEGGGVITIETACEAFDPAMERGLRLGGELPAGNYVRLTVRDTGAGMDAATQARMFEPFFSTRFTGRGLGLAAVHGIVRGHRGVMRVTSQPGQGSAIQLWLPALAALAPAPAPAPAGPPGERGTVLLIDDDAAVRLVTRRMLERLGYQVQEATGGAVGLQLLAEGIAGLAAVLLDLTMPEMGGEVVSEAIAREHPGMPVVLMSGYSAEEIRWRHHDLPAAGILQKPFGINALGQMLDQIAR